MAGKSFKLEGILTLDSSPFTRKMRMASRSALSFGKNLASIGFKALAVGAAAATTAALAFGAVAARTIAEFGMEMSKVKALTGATEEEFAALTAKARELGATTAFSASEAAAGMAFLAQAGFDTNAILNASGDLLNLAAAGGLELANAMDIASNIMTPFGMAADEAGRVSDVLASAAASANTNVEQLGEAFKKVAPISSQLGISFEETAAAIGVLGNAGIQGGDAGTALKNIMARLVKPTGEVTAGLKRLGLTQDQVNPATHSLSEMFETFQKAAEKVGDRAEIAAAGVGIFGLRANAAGGVLMKTAGAIGELDEKMLSSAGSAKQMADVMMDNLGGDFKILKSVFAELQLAIGEGGLTSVLREAVQWATALMKSFIESGKAKAVGKAIREAADAFQAAFADPEQMMKVLAAGLEYAVLQGIDVLRKGFVGAVELLSGAMGAWWKGNWQQVKGWSDLLMNGLLFAAATFVGFMQVGLAGILATLSAGMGVVIQEVLEVLGQIPGLGKKMGLKGYKAQTFGELAEEEMTNFLGRVGVEENKKLIDAFAANMDDAALEISDGAHAVATWMKGIADGSTKEKARKKFLEDWNKLVEAGLKARKGREDAAKPKWGHIKLKARKRGPEGDPEPQLGDGSFGKTGLDSLGGLKLGSLQTGKGGLGKTDKGLGGYNQVRRGDAKRKKALIEEAKKKAEEEKLDVERNALLAEQVGILKGAFAPAN